jgi:myo-inositol-1(or 4)-monophosphatase
MPATPAARPRDAFCSDAQALEFIIAAAQAAGKIALPFFCEGAKTTAAIETKDGGSPVTEADLLADAYLRKILMAALPGAAWLSEESADDPVRLTHQDVLIVDPIDGTRGFITGDPRWTVCVALVRNGEPVAGVVHAPALGETFSAAKGGGAWLNGRRLTVSTQAAISGAKMAGPRALLEATGADSNLVTWHSKIPSLAYRMALVASGGIDAAFASANAHDWDIAAVDLIVREAGGVFSTLDGVAPLYNLASPVHAALAAAPPALHQLFIKEKACHV